MDTQMLYKLLSRVHALEGKLIELITSDAQPDAGQEAAVRSEVEAISGMLSAGVENGEEDLTKTLASMYDEPAEERVAVGIPDEVAHITDEVPQVGDATDEYFDDEGADNLEVFEEDEDDEPEESAVEGKHPDLSYITINERARFRNNLFGGSKDAFDQAMTVLQQLTSYHDAVNYCCNDLEWDVQTNEVAAEFLNKIHDCFRLAR